MWFKTIADGRTSFQCCSVAARRSVGRHFINYFRLFTISKSVHENAQIADGRFMAGRRWPAAIVYLFS